MITAFTFYILTCTHLWTLSRTFLGVCTHPYTGARVSSTYARAHTFPRPVDSSANLLLLFMSISSCCYFSVFSSVCRNDFFFNCKKKIFVTCVVPALCQIMYSLSVCSDGTTEAQPRSFRQNRPPARTLSLTTCSPALANHRMLPSTTLTSSDIKPALTPEQTKSINPKTFPRFNWFLTVPLMMKLYIRNVWVHVDLYRSNPLIVI